MQQCDLELFISIYFFSHSLQHFFFIKTQYNAINVLVLFLIVQSKQCGWAQKILFLFIIKLHMAKMSYSERLYCVSGHSLVSTRYQGHPSNLAVMAVAIMGRLWAFVTIKNRKIDSSFLTFCFWARNCINIWYIQRWTGVLYIIISVDNFQDRNVWLAGNF